MSDCAWCGKPLSPPLDIDHIIPRGRGGPDQEWNRQSLHQRCNRIKGNTLTPAAVALARKHQVLLVPDWIPADWKDQLAGDDTGEYDDTPLAQAIDLLMAGEISELSNLIAEDAHTWLPVFRELRPLVRDFVNLQTYIAVRLERRPETAVAREMGISRQALLKRIDHGNDVFHKLVRLNPALRQLSPSVTAMSNK